MLFSEDLSRLGKKRSGWYGGSGDGRVLHFLIRLSACWTRSIMHLTHVDVCMNITCSCIGVYTRDHDIFVSPIKNLKSCSLSPHPLHPLSNDSKMDMNSWTGPEDSKGLLDREVKLRGKIVMLTGFLSLVSPRSFCLTIGLIVRSAIHYPTKKAVLQTHTNTLTPDLLLILKFL